MVPVGQLSDLPASFHAVVRNCVRDFVAVDCGLVQHHNNQSFESRAAHFATWCKRMGFTQHHLSRLDDDTCIHVLGTYVSAVHAGDNKKSLTNVTAQTLTNYLAAAHSWIKYQVGRKIDILDPHSTGKRTKYHPFLGQQMADCRAWSRPCQKKEPFTTDMFVGLQRKFTNSPDPVRCFLDKESTVYDWCRLGVFTAFRVTEYAQGRLLKGQKFQLVPTNAFVPDEFWGTLLAFIMDDFTFYDTKHCSIPIPLVHAKFLKGEVMDLKIRWRYDKSAHNSTIWRFRTTDHPIFNPVAAAVSIVHQHTLLKVPLTHPLGVFSSTRHSFRFLKDIHVHDVMRHAVDLAYPDASHYMQKHKHLVLPHSNRVTAAVCLQRGGASNDEIAFKLRWHPTSVPTYLRDCFQAVGDTLQKTVTGVMNMTFSAASA